MNVIAAMRLPLSVDLGGFVKMLRRLQVPHRVVEQGQEQILWVPESLAEGVRELYQRYPEGNDEIQLPEEVLAGMAQRPSWLSRPGPARSPPGCCWRAWSSPC